MRIFKLLLGILLIPVGFFLLAIPGPGLLVVLIGLGVLASESRVVARLLDRSEVYARDRGMMIANRWRETSLPGRLAVAALLGVLVAAGFGALVLML